MQNMSSINLSSSVLAETVPEVKKKPTLLSYTLHNLWQFVYMSLVNKNNIRGLEYACILYGLSELKPEFEPFFGHLFRIHM